MKKANDSEDKITFSVVFEGEPARRFDKLKRYYGLENNTELIRILLFEKFKDVFPTEAKAEA